MFLLFRKKLLPALCLIVFVTTAYVQPVLAGAYRIGEEIIGLTGEHGAFTGMQKDPNGDGSLLMLKSPSGTIFLLAEKDIKWRQFPETGTTKNETPPDKIGGKQLALPPPDNKPLLLPPPNPNLAPNSDHPNNGLAPKLKEGALPPGWKSNQGVAADTTTSTTSAAGDGPGVARLRAALDKKRDLGAFLNKNVFGQPVAIAQIVQTISTASKKGNVLPTILVFMGPSGGGKTYTAELLASQLNGGKILNISGNEYRAHAGSLDYGRLFGTRGGTEPKDGVIQNMVRANPDGFTLVIDEGEKMNPDVWLMFMEFFSKGTLSDKDGKTLTAKNMTVIITSNRGAARIIPPEAKDWKQADIDKRLRTITQEQLKALFTHKEKDDGFVLPPEVMNRITAYMPFGPTTKEAAGLIAKAVSEKLNEFYFKQFSLRINFTGDSLQTLGVAAWKLSNDSRTIIRAVETVMSQTLDEGLENLKLNDGNVIDVATKNDKYGNRVFVASANGHSFQIPVNNPVENPLYDLAFRKRLKNMRKLMAQIVMGQDGAINDISDALLAHYGQANINRPFTAFFIGPSGNGKTELGRALAKILHDDPKMSVVFPMGEITTPDNFDQFLDEFESALISHPNGAVFILDEFSNMGGGSIAMKNAFAKRFYNMYEEGVYKSKDGEHTYDLKNFQFVMTGNDGEQLFAGVTADDSLDSIWNANNSPEQVRKILVAAGIPIALLNRIDVLGLTKPLMAKTAAAVTKKLWDRQVEDFTSNYKGVEIVPAKKMLDQLAATFFTADQGGRSVRKILENKVGAILISAMMNANADLRNLTGYKIVVDLADSATKKPYIDKPGERTVLFKSSVYKNGKLVHTEILDVTRTAPQDLTLLKGSVQQVASHEIGHAITSNSQLTGRKIKFLTVRSGSNGDLAYYGYVSYEADKRVTGGVSYEKLMAHLTELYGGRKGQELAGFPGDTGWSDDLRQMRQQVSNYLLYGGMEPDFLGVNIDKDGNPIMSERLRKKFEKRTTELIEEGGARAEKIIKDNWAAFQAATKELLEKGSMDGARFELIRERNGAAIPDADVKSDTAPSKGSRPSVKAKRAQTLSCQALFL